MTNKDILRIAMEQSAIDLNCLPEDFLRTDNVLVYSQVNNAARRYLNLPSITGCDASWTLSVSMKHS